MSQQFNPNVIVFGETGAGKSSVVNMLLGTDKAKVGNSLLGETFKRTVYPAKLDGKIYHLHDTVGLGEHTGGTVDNGKAVKNLYRLVTELSGSGGVNLLVFVIKCGQRLTETMHKNYTLFHVGFCESKVPIVVVVTGCENVEPPMDTWWSENAKSFTQAKMSFDGHACVCAFKGARMKNGGYRNEDLVEESVGVVKELIFQHCTSDGWKKPSIAWLRQISGAVVDLFSTSKVPTIYNKLFHRLTDVFTTSEAESIIETIIQSDSQPTPNVIVFGETGSGKSSLINLILGSNKATVDGSRLEQPIQSAVYAANIHGDKYNLHDTVGLGEHNGNVDAARATGNIYRLVADLSDTGGVNLLVYVVRCNKRPVESLRKHYSLIHHGFCDSKVPIVIVVTGCENVVPTMDQWWIDNEPLFTTAGMSFHDHACVCARTTNSSGEYRNEDPPESVVKQLIAQHCIPTGWKKQPIASPQPSIKSIFSFSKIPTVYKALYDRLKSTVSPLEAEKIIEAIRNTGK